MKSKFITNPQDPSDGFLNTAGLEFYGSFSSAAKPDKEAAAKLFVEIPLSPALTSEAAASLCAQSGPTTAVCMTAGSFTIHPRFAAGAMAAPASFPAGTLP